MGRGRVGGGDVVERKKNVKVPASRQIADAISKIVSASKSCSTVVNNLVVPGSCIGEVMTKIQNTEAITGNFDWHARCCKLLLEKPKRNVCSLERK